MDAFRASPLGELIGSQARDKYVPDFVWTGGWGVKRAFLMAAFECDGDVRVALDGFTIQYSSYSERLSRELQELLAEFGVTASLRSYTRPSGSVEYRLVISGLSNVRAYAERVGFLRAKQAKLRDLLTRSPLRPHRLSQDRVPFVADYVRSSLDFGRRGTGKSWLTNHDFDRQERWATERLRIIDRIKDPEVLAVILPIMDSGYRFETVASVESAEAEEVYSVRVESADHSFLAGGFVNHNTEARLSNEAMLLVGELGEDTVDFRPNYDGSELEPTVLPAAFPNLLVNGTSGIAVGMATNMIPHNLGEVIAAARWLITHPDASLDDLMKRVPGPDLPTGGMLLGLDEVRKAYETGRGVVRMRARVETGPLEGSRGRQAITVTELPYGVGPEKIIEKITDEVTKSKRLTGIADVKDLTDRENGTRLVIECKVGVNPTALLADLYRLTPMEQSFGINNLVLVDGQPQTLGLKALLEVFLKHRYEVVTRRTRYRRRKREERLHLVEGLLIALLDIDKVIRLIRTSENAQEAKDGLMQRFKLSEIQATYILDTPLRRLTKFDKIELETEQDRLRAEIAELTTILDDDVGAEEAGLGRAGQGGQGPCRAAPDRVDRRRPQGGAGGLGAGRSAGGGRRSVPGDPVGDRSWWRGRPPSRRSPPRRAGAAAGPGMTRSRRSCTPPLAARSCWSPTGAGRSRPMCCRCRCCRRQMGTVSLSGGMAANELAPLDKGERVIGIAPLTTGGFAGHRAGHPAGRGEGVLAGVAGALGRVRGDHAQGRRRGGRRDLADRRVGDAGVRVLGGVAVAVRGVAGAAAGVEGRRHGRAST